MNYHGNQIENQVDAEAAQRIYLKLSANNELAQSVYNLFYQIFEKHPGDKFTRFAKREFRDRNEERSRRDSSEQEREGGATGSRTAEPTQAVASVTEEPSVNSNKFKKRLQLSKAWEKPAEKPLEKKVEFVLDNHRKVIEKFKESHLTIKPNPSLAAFREIPILDLDRKPMIEEPEFFKPRKSSFNKVS